MTPRAHALTVLADLREDDAIVRYVTGERTTYIDWSGLALNGRPQVVTGSGFPPSASLSGASSTGSADAPLVTPSIFIDIHRRQPSSRREGRSRRHPLLVVALAVPVLLLLRFSELAYRLALRWTRE